MFPQLKQRIQDTLKTLEEQLVSLHLSVPSPISLLTPSSQEQDKGPGDQSTPDDISKAKEAIAAGLKSIREVS